MSFWQTLKIALRALFGNKLRTLLTGLGIIIGVAAVVAMVAIGEGAKARVQTAFAAMGTDVLVVSSGSSTAGGLRAGSGSQPTITWADLRAIQSELPAVRAAAPQLKAPVQAIVDERNWGTTVFGVTPDYFEIRHWPVDDGDGIEQADVDAHAKVAVLGRSVAEQLFATAESAVGRTLRLKNAPFTIIGVAAEKGQSASGHDYDDAIFIPVTTFTSQIQGGLDQYLAGVIYAGARSSDDTSHAEQQIGDLLRQRHRVTEASGDDFTIKNLAELAAARAEGTDAMTAFLACIAAVSLLVGGVGIMNIMLVSVTERTREIGLRMALGARRTAVLAQFLTEALLLGVAGGVTGVGLGVALAAGLGRRFDWPVLVRADVAIVALVVSAGVSVLFGLYPALRASRMHPMEALRHE